MKIAIIIVAYNRLGGLVRLLNSLCRADYGGDAPTLIISIDKSNTKKIEEFAEKYEWPYGEKIVRTFEKNQGLKKHILSCGDFFEIYDALIVLEDDIYVAPSFYMFAKQCSMFYENDPNIAGISLYQHLYSIDASRPFTPINKGADVYFMKYAQSWGQVWLKKQWLEFRKWYDNNSNSFAEHTMLPENVCAWPSGSSWLKYHIKYCVEQNKYFVYPYISQTTCFSDVGEHSFVQIKRLQVPMLYGRKKHYVLVELDKQDEKCVLYDQYFENEDLETFLDCECDIDLYGRRKYTNKRYILSTKILGYEIIKSWDLNLRPHEANVFLNIPGNSIFLYDTQSRAVKKKKENIIELWQYDNRTEGLIKQEMKVLMKELMRRFFRK